MESFQHSPTALVQNTHPPFFLGMHRHPFYGSLDFVWDYLGELVPEPIWILLKQETEWQWQ